MNGVKISVITVCYNAAEHIEKTILSVVGQTFTNYEYIIIDGGSTDGTIDIVKKYLNKIDYFITEADDGIYDAMNKGIYQARGEYLNFLNAGDYYFSDRTLAKVSNKLTNEDYVCGIAKIGKCKYWIPISRFASATRIAHGHNINHQASFIKRKLFKDGYDIHYPIMADDFFFFHERVINKCTYRRLWIVTNWYDRTGISCNPMNTSKIQSERRLFWKKNGINEAIFTTSYFVCSLFFEKVCHKFLSSFIWIWIEKNS